MSFTANIDDVVAENRNHLLGKHPTWGRVRLKEVANILNGFPFESERFRKSEGTPLIRIRDILQGRTETFYEGEFDLTFLVKRGEILIGMDGDFHCESWSGEPALLNQRVCKITPDESRYEKQFLRYVLPGYLSAINAQTPSVTVKHLSSRTIADIPLPLPPLPEQRLIVAEIEKQFTRLDAGVAALKRVQANLKRYRASVLKAACSGQLVPTEAALAEIKNSKLKIKNGYETGEELLQRILKERREKWQGRGKYKEPNPPDTTNLPELPEGWAWGTVDALAEVKGGITKDQNRKFTVQARLIPYLRVANVQRGRLDLVEVKEIMATEDEIQELALKPGDLLFNEGGDRDKLGRGWVWNGELPECIHQNHVFRARLFGNGINPKFISWYANTFGQKFFFDEGKHTTNLASISMSKLKGLPVPIPPIAEQTRIVAEVERRLSVVEELEAVVAANLQRATRLRQAILQKAFEGKLASVGDSG